MKTLHLIMATLLLSVFQLQAQTRLNVEGDANILGRISTKVADRSVIIGEDAGINLNNDANSNVFLGVQAGKDSENAEDNIFIGRAAGFRSEGIENVMIGRSAGFEFAGENNIIIGTSAGGGIGGNNNVYLGDRVGSSPLNRGNGNVFLGSSSGRDNTIGQNNVFVGGIAGQSNTEGNFNTFVGTQAGRSYLGLGGDFNNSFFGSQAGKDLVAGQSNTFLGASTGDNIQNADALTLVGAGANSRNNINNTSSIGAYAIANQSNQVVLGNVATTELQAYNNWSTLSDKRFKNNIRNNVKGLDFILQLRPVTYQVNAKKLDDFLRKPLGKIASIDTIEAYQAALKAKSNITYTGFIAQEVEEAAAATNFDFSGVVLPEHEEDHYTLRYAEFVVPLVKAVQEQQAIIEEKEARIENLETRLIRLEALLANNEIETRSKIRQEEEKPSLLAQNYPNPFSEETTIEFEIPKDVQQAELIVTDLNGHLLRSYTLSNQEGYRTIKKGDFSSGIYQYALIVDGEIVESKQMVLMNR